MSSIKEIHDQAMILAQQANAALQKKDHEQYRQLCGQAFALEKEAAIQLTTDFNAEPTRSVLFRSAASLAFNAEMYRDARQMIHLALAGDPFDEIKQELYLLLNSISEIDHDKLKNVQYKPDDEVEWIVREDEAVYKTKEKDDRPIPELPVFFIGKETANQQIKRFGETVQTNVSTWYPKEYFELLTNELNYLHANGARLYFGMRDQTGTINTRETCVIMVPTKLNDDAIPEDIIPEEMPGFESRVPFINREQHYGQIAGVPEFVFEGRGLKYPY